MRLLNRGMVALFVAAPLVVAGSAHSIEKCQVCHSRKDLVRTEATGKQLPLYIDTLVIQSSVHSHHECTDCHVDIVDIPHRHAKKVNCRRCHYSGNTVGAPQGDLYDRYAHSVHGMEVAKGNPKAPVCQDCHGTHHVLSPDSVGSMMYKTNRPRTCGKCHIDIYATYRESIHGQALARGVLDAPDCSGCHGEHDIRKPEDTTSSVSPEHIAETCGKCHGPKGVAAKYGIKPDRTKTYEHSFHGIAQSLEYRTVANCASCHGYHDIRPENDPRSRVNPANIVKTCGQPQCHPEATPQFATGKIHVDPTKKESGLVYYITKFFTILTVSVLAGLFVFILLDLYRRAKANRAARRG